MTVKKKEPLCSFCGIDAMRCDYLISGVVDVYICDQCIESCRDIIGERRQQNRRFDELLKKPGTEEEEE